MSRLNLLLDALAARATDGLGRPGQQQRTYIQQRQTEYDQKSPPEKMLYEAELWIKALTLPGTPIKALILKRIFLLLRNGGLMFRPDQTGNAWRTWESTGWTIASALSHGGRVMVQLPMSDPRYPDRPDDGFFNWLTAETVLNRQNGVTRVRSGTHSTGNRIDDHEVLPGGRVKVLKELKGGSYGAGQFLKTSVGRSYGINIALGGNLNPSPYDPKCQQKISDNGCYGHLYLFYRPPMRDKFGGMLIGCEGEEDGKWGVSGNFHSWNLGPVDAARGYRGSGREAFFGPKWRNVDFRLPDQGNSGQLINGPANYDSLVIDLTSGWNFLLREEENYNNLMIKSAAAPPRNIPIPAQQLAANNVPRRYAEIWDRLPPEALGLRLYHMTNKFGLPPTNPVVAAYCQAIYN